MKKFLSLVLSAVMLFPVFPCGVFAFEDDSLILYYSFDNGAAADVGSDAESFGVSFSEESVSGKSAFFDGGSSYLKLSSDINGALGGDFTVSAWVKVEEPNWWMRIFDFGEDTSSYAFLALSSPTDIRYALLTDETKSELNMTALNCVEDGKWLNLTLVREGTVMKLYTNGALAVSSKAFGENTPADIENAQNYIGKSQFNDPYFHGYIDEFKVFSKALSDTEVISNMADGIKIDYASYVVNTVGLSDGMTAKENLNLITFETENAALAWSSSDESVISPEGVVSRGDEDASVTLTAAVTLGDETAYFPYIITVPAVSSVDAKIAINAARKGVDINPEMVGLFFEDINYAADGGLYAELVQNRSFEAVNAQASVTNPAPIPSYAWTTSVKNSAAYLSSEPLNENNTTYLRIFDPSALDSISNACYSGFSVTAGQKFDFSMYAKKNGELTGQILVSIFDGEKVIGRAYISNISSDWSKYEAEITATEAASNAVLKITILGSSSKNSYIDFDMISLFPQDTWMNRKNGLRADLVQMLKDFHPGFLRFPGGCIVEGYSLENRYSWKDTVGPVEERKENWNRWQMHTSGDGRYAYCQSYGLGFYEYFLLCEDIGAQPLPVVNVGIGCEYQAGDTSSMEELYSVYIQDALDLIEFANGDPAANEWAALRAEMGHPEPFNLEYIGIGNEQWETSNVNFFERYEAFEKEIHAKYPEMKLIATSGPDASGSKFDTAWTWLSSHSDNGEDDFAFAVDEHYYRTPTWFYTNLDRYDGYDRNGYKVFAGEYASRYTQTSPSESNMEAALSVAAFMTSLERNADVVRLASYAPLFSRDGYTQWYPDMIGFDESRVFGTPDYYVQSMYSNNLGSYTLENSTVNTEAEYVPNGKTGLGTWATAVEYSDYEIWDNDNDCAIEPEDIGAVSGDWTGLNQNSTTVTGAFKFLANPDSSNYTVTFKAKKTAGSEGFLIPILWADDSNYFTWNVGGWGNTYSAIQQTVNGTTTELSVQNTAATIETGREYELKIEVTPTKIACYLDGECINFASFKQNVYSSTSYDEITGDIIIKAVNTSSLPMETSIRIANAEYINPVADVTELKTDNIYAINSLSDPTNISPSYFETEASDSFIYMLPANSLSVLRIHTKANSEIAERAEDTEIEILKGESLSLPDEVTVFYKDGSSDALSVIWDSIPEEFTSVSGRKTVEGKVSGTNIYAYANVTISETGKASVILPKIIPTDNSVQYSIAFSEGSADEFSIRAILAGYDEEGALIKVTALPLNADNTFREIDLADFSEAASVKAFMFNSINNLTDCVTVR